MFVSSWQCELTRLTHSRTPESRTVSAANTIITTDDVFLRRCSLQTQHKGYAHVDCRSCYMPTCTVVDRVRYKLAVTVHRCLHNKAPKYRTVCCVAVSDIANRQRLRSTHRRQLDVPRYRRTTLVRRPLSLDQPSGIRFQTSLEKRLKTLSGCHYKRRFSDNISVFSALEVFLRQCTI